MPFRIGPDITPFVVRARIALGMTQKQLGAMFQASMRTAHRWEMGQAYPDVDQVQKLARAVFLADPQLAAELAEQAGTTLEALGLVSVPKADPAAAPPPVPPRPFPPVGLMIDSIVLAAVDAIEGQAPGAAARQTVWSILRAGFARARGLGLTVEEVDDALTPPATGKATAGKK